MFRLDLVDVDVDVDVDVEYATLSGRELGGLYSDDSVMKRAGWWRVGGVAEASTKGIRAQDGFWLT